MPLRYVTATNAIAFTASSPPSLIHVYDTVLDQWFFPWEVSPRSGSPRSVMALPVPSRPSRVAAPEDDALLAEQTDESAPLLLQ